ncbi:hypothetical protein BS78_08G087700 [Paspalum vaginatum]|nr:hypothetical protein BS78_08G087700 [Paspalum vaginatum]
MRLGSTVALAAAAALLVSLAMLLVSLPVADMHEQETRRMFMEWKAMYRKIYALAGEEECRYAVFKETRHRVARAMAAGVRSSSALNGFSATTIEELQWREKSYEQETRRMFVGWKAKYGKTYRDLGEEKCRYRLFMGNRGVVIVRLKAAAGRNVYGLNQFGDLTNEEVRQRCYPEIEDRELSARCQAAVLDSDSDPVQERLIR